MSVLLLTRGLPASGKTTWARAWVAEDPTGRARVNRDDLRANLFGAQKLDYTGEQAVTAAQHAAVRALLTAGRSVVVDDTNLRVKYARAWVDLAAAAGAEWATVDFLDVPVEECVRRAERRFIAGGVNVPDTVIQGMHDRYLTNGPLPAVTTTAMRAPTYEPDESLPPAWLVDIDGTLALMGERSPYDWHRVGEDTIYTAVCTVVQALSESAVNGRGIRVILLSGRDGSCREQTEEWLARHSVPYEELHMRAAGDNRKDSTVKAELFDAHVRGRFNVVGVLDDRDSVVALWRGMGLPCFQVAPGAF